MIKETKRLLGGVALGLAVVLTGASLPLTATATPNAVQRQRRATTNSSTFLVDDNTLVEATLNTRLSAKTARNGARFTATVTSPSRFRGATVYGYISDAKESGRVRGSSQLTLNFERIRYNGRSYRFAGAVESVRTPDGDEINVNEEGSVSEETGQGERTVGRTVLGSGVGAVIGAIAGGGKGAAIGAAVGGGAGAGSVLIQGRDNLNLESGTRMVIRASAPNR